jgi:hypothetical protein
MNGTCFAAEASVGPLYVTEMPSCLPAAFAPTPFSVKTGIPMNFGIRKNFVDSADRRCGAALPTLATSTAARAARSTMPATIVSLRLRMNPSLLS